MVLRSGRRLPPRLLPSSSPPEPGLAATDAEEACRLYDEVDLSYEAARVSLLLCQIRQASGESESAHAEVSSALTTFESFGALAYAARARDLLAAS